MKAKNKKVTTQKQLKKHEDNYIHIPKVIGYIFFPIYAPIFFLSIIGLVILEAIIKIFFLCICFIVGLFNSDFFEITYNPNYKIIMKEFDIMEFIK